MLVALLLSGFFLHDRIWIRWLSLIFILPWAVPSIPTILSVRFMTAPHHPGQAHHRARLAGRGVGGSASAVPAGPGYRLPELLRLPQGCAERPQGRPAPLQVEEGQPAVHPLQHQRLLQHNGTVYVAKVGAIKVNWSRPLPAAPTSLTVTKDGRTGTSWLRRRHRTAHPPRAGYRSRYRPGPDHLRRPLRRHADPLARIFCGAPRRNSSGCRRTCAARPGDREPGQGPYPGRAAPRPGGRPAPGLHHKLSTQIIRDNQAVYVEDLAVSGLARTRLAKSVHDAGWSAFVNMLEYKAVGTAGTSGRSDASSRPRRVCSVCGVKDGPKPLHVRQWTCSGCGAVHDRDDNASRNTLAAGRADRLNASQSAGKTRAKVPAQRVEAGSHPDGHTTVAGIPGL